MSKLLLCLYIVYASYKVRVILCINIFFFKLNKQFNNYWIKAGNVLGGVIH